MLNTMENVNQFFFFVYAHCSSHWIFERIWCISVHSSIFRVWTIDKSLSEAFFIYVNRKSHLFMRALIYEIVQHWDSMRWMSHHSYGASRRGWDIKIQAKRKRSESTLNMYIYKTGYNWQYDINWVVDIPLWKPSPLPEHIAFHTSLCVWNTYIVSLRYVSVSSKYRIFFCHPAQ